MLYEYQYTKGACYSDIPFHTNIIMSCIMGCNSKVKLNGQKEKLMSVFFAGEPLAYSLMPDWYSASLMLSGFTSIRYALFIPSLFVAFSLITSFYSLAYYYSKSHFISALSFILFFNLGGLSWTHILEFTYSSQNNRKFANQEGILSFILSNFGFTIDNHRENDWIHMWGSGKEEYWFHPITHIILPQRGSLWSMPLCYWTLLILILASRFQDKKLMALAGILTGLTPQVQVHSFVALAQWSISYCIMTFIYYVYITYKKNSSEFRFNLLFKISFDIFVKFVKLWGIYGLLSVAIALPQIGSFLNRIESSKNNFVQLNPIWNTPYQSGHACRPAALWWNGLGVFGAISIVFGWVAISKRQLFLYVPSFIVFLIANFIRYQPWELDNTKVFYACWIPFAVPFVATFLTRILFPFEKPLKSQASKTTKDAPAVINHSSNEGFVDRNKKIQNDKESEKAPKSVNNNNNEDFSSLAVEVLIIFFSILAFLILLFSSIASSLIHLYQWYFFPCPIYEKSDYMFGLWIAENTPIKAIFLSHGYPQDPVGSVAGRQLHLGYPGWVDSHGLDYHQRWNDEHMMLRDPENREWFEKEKIDYVAHFKYGKKNCEIKNASNVWKLVFDNDRYKVWKLR